MAQLLHHHTILEFADTGAGKVRQVEFGDQCCFLEKAPTQKPGAMEGAWRSMGNSLREATLGGNLVAAWWKPSGVLVSWCGLWRWQEGGKPGGKEAWEEMAHLHSCQGASRYENLARIAKAFLH